MDHLTYYVLSRVLLTPIGKLRFTFGYCFGGRNHV